MPNNNLYIELPEFNSLNESNNTFVFDEFSTTTGQIVNLPINIISGLFNTGTTSNDDLEGRFTSAIEIFVDTSDPITTNGPTIEFEVSTATLFVKKVPGFSKAFDPISGDPTDGFTFKIEPEELHTNNIDNEGIYTFEVELFGTLGEVSEEHDHEDGTSHSHPHDGDHTHGDGGGGGEGGEGGEGSNNDPESGTGGSDDPPIFE